MEDRTSALEDKEGFDCFVHSVDLLTKGLLEQSLCLRPTPSLKEMMKVKSGRVTIYPRRRNLCSMYYRHNGRIEFIKENLKRETGWRLRWKQEWQMYFVQLSRLGLPPKGTTINITDIINNSDITENISAG